MADVYVDDGAIGANNGTSLADAFESLEDLHSILVNPVDDVWFTEGSGPYTMPSGGFFDGGGNNKTYHCNGVTITGKVDLNSSSYQWVQSTANPLEYYIEAAAGGDPSLSTVSVGTINSKFQEAQAEESQYQMGTVGSLGDEFFGYGDNDSLGFNTVYARYDLGLSDINVYVSQYDRLVHTNFTNTIWEDAIFEYANTSATNYFSGSLTTTFRRCVARYISAPSGGHGFDLSGAGSMILENCIGFFAGHRMWNVSTATAGNMTVRGCLDINSHLFGIVHATWAGTLTFGSNILFKTSAGAIDTNANSSMTLVNEGYNWWYPSFAGSGALEYPDGADNIWTTTAATDSPPSTDTGIGTIAAIEAAGGADPLLVNINLRDFDACDFGLSESSPALGTGFKWWTEVSRIGYSGEPLPAFEIDPGPSQSTFNPSHPTKL